MKNCNSGILRDCCLSFSVCLNQDQRHVYFPVKCLLLKCAFYRILQGGLPPEGQQVAATVNHAVALPVILSYHI